VLDCARVSSFVLQPLMNYIGSLVGGGGMEP